MRTGTTIRTLRRRLAMTAAAVAAFGAAALAAPLPAAAGGAEEPIVLGPVSSLDAFAWLEGSWTRWVKGGDVVETWKRVSKDTMEGIATLTRGEESVVTEVLRLERYGDEIFYVAKPRENAMPTPFKLVSSGTRFAFENPEHDFPQRIVYVRAGENGIRVRIEGMDEGQPGLDFLFRKVEGDSAGTESSAPWAP